MKMFVGASGCLSFVVLLLASTACGRVDGSEQIATSRAALDADDAVCPADVEPPSCPIEGEPQADCAEEVGVADDAATTDATTTSGGDVSTASLHTRGITGDASCAFACAYAYQSTSALARCPTATKTFNACRRVCRLMETFKQPYNVLGCQRVCDILWINYPNGEGVKACYATCNTIFAL